MKARSDRLSGDSIRTTLFVNEPLTEAGLSGGVAALNYVSNKVIHSHSSAQLIYPIDAALVLEVAGHKHFVALSTALWIPAGKPHRLLYSQAECVACLHVNAGHLFPLPPRTHTVVVSALLHELLLHFPSRASAANSKDNTLERFALVLLDELCRSDEATLALPFPEDRRLCRLVSLYTTQFPVRRSLDDWGRQIGMSARTLARAFRSETGLSFGEWARHFQVTWALQRLASGHSVNAIAEALGFSHPSAFIVMFKKVLGESPARFATRPPSSPPYLQK